MRNARIALIAAGLAVALTPALASAQALTSLSSLSVSYSTRKATVRPAGELKTKIDDVDQQIAAARKNGQNAEVRRWTAKGMALLNNRPWDDVADYTTSLLIRTEHSVADSSKPYAVRLEQMYSPSIELTRSLRAHVTVKSRPQPAPAAGQPAPAQTIVKDLGNFDGVARDLRESPYRFDLDVHDVADGTYQLAIDVKDGDRALGTATLTVNFRKGLDTLVASLEDAAKRAPANLRADILFPVDRMDNVNRGRLELRTFDPDKDFASAQAVLASVKANKDPFAKKTGDFKRHYTLEMANEIMPYRMYVPTGYDGTKAYPLIIALHGLGNTEDAFFDNYDKTFVPLAEQHGYIVAAPLGYRVDGGYGYGVGNPPADPVQRQTRERSEADVMQVLQIVRQTYKIDPNRIYLEGHSLGAIGTWLIAPKYPDIWAAIAPISGQGQPASLERIAKVPEIVVHGDDDRTVNVQGSRTMVAKLKELGTEFKYIEVPGGSHGGVPAPNFAAIFDFFDAHQKARASTTQQQQ
ncbi:MAG TPA: PHB depolymerase family esterase [Vicinamibacterales bacterium]|nr:PHB depolymerase family esterase [Vicinamibacterales bacterium]